MKLRSRNITTEESSSKEDKDRLYMAAKNDNVDEIETLICINGVGPDFLYDNKENHQDDGESPVHTAIRNKKPNTLTALLNLGASVNFRNALGDTPFLTAVAEGNLAAMKELYKINASVINDTHTNTANEEVSTALMYSAIWGRYDVAFWLLSPRRSTYTPEEITNALFETLTHRQDYELCDYGLSSNDLISLIINNGADLTQLNDNNQTPLHLALEKGTDILIQHDNCPDMMIEEAKNTITIVTMLLEAGNLDTFNVRCTSNFTPLEQIAWAFTRLLNDDDFLLYNNSTNDIELNHAAALDDICSSVENEDEDEDEDENEDAQLAKIQLAVIAKLTHLLKEHDATMTLDIDSMVTVQGEGYRESFQQFQTLIDLKYATSNNLLSTSRLFSQTDTNNSNDNTPQPPLKVQRR